MKYDLLKIVEWYKKRIRISFLIFNSHFFTLLISAISIAVIPAYFLIEYLPKKFFYFGVVWILFMIALLMVYSFIIYPKFFKKVLGKFFQNTNPKYIFKILTTIFKDVTINDIEPTTFEEIYFLERAKWGINPLKITINMTIDNVDIIFESYYHYKKRWVESRNLTKKNITLLVDGQEHVIEVDYSFFNLNYYDDTVVTVSQILSSKKALSNIINNLSNKTE